jgi:hypothetical protein
VFLDQIVFQSSIELQFEEMPALTRLLHTVMSNTEWATASDGCHLGDMVMSFQLRIRATRFANATNSLLLCQCYPFEDTNRRIQAF